MLESDRDLDISVITERRFADRYPAGVAVSCVPSVADLTAVRSAAFALSRRRPIERVISGTERTQQAAGYLRSLLNVPGMGFRQANLFSNKLAMKSALRRAGLPVADFHAVYSPGQMREAAEELGWPVVIKPAIGQGALDTHLVRAPSQLRDLLGSPGGESLFTKPSPVLVERYVKMDGELHCDGVVRDGNVEFIAVSRYFEPMLDQAADVFGSYFLPDGDPLTEPARRTHAAVVRALGLDAGVTHLELFVSGDRLTVGEIACRPGGAYIPDGVRIGHGLDLQRVHADISLGTPSEPPRRDREIKGILACCGFRQRPGRITRLGSPADLAEVPGLIRADVVAAVGDVARAPLASAASIALAYLDVPREDLLRTRLEALSERFVYEYERPRGDALAGRPS